MTPTQKRTAALHCARRAESYADANRRKEAEAFGNACVRLAMEYTRRSHVCVYREILTEKVPA